MIKVDIRTVVALVALALAASEYLRKPTPAPPPPAPSGLVLKGLFVGPTASEDAVAIAGMCAELADLLEWDGALEQPRVQTGQAWDDLRNRLREARMRGVSIGARQPHARDAIHKYLDQTAGVNGGEMPAELRLKWINAYRDISRAAEDASN